MSCVSVCARERVRVRVCLRACVCKKVCYHAYILANTLPKLNANLRASEKQVACRGQIKVFWLKLL